MSTRTFEITTAPEVPPFSAEEVRRALWAWQNKTEVGVMDVSFSAAREADAVAIWLAASDKES